MLRSATPLRETTLVVRRGGLLLAFCHPALVARHRQKLGFWHSGFLEKSLNHFTHLRHKIEQLPARAMEERLLLGVSEAGAYQVCGPPPDLRFGVGRARENEIDFVAEAAHHLRDGRAVEWKSCNHRPVSLAFYLSLISNTAVQFCFTVEKINRAFPYDFKNIV